MFSSAALSWHAEFMKRMLATAAAKNTDAYLIAKPTADKWMSHATATAERFRAEALMQGQSCWHGELTFHNALWPMVARADGP